MQRELFKAEISLDKLVNISQVKHRSPFRYPGGKTWLVPLIRSWLLSKTRVVNFIEPFAGSGIIGLTVAFDDLAEHVTLLEIDPNVASVWKVIIEGSKDDMSWLVNRIRSFILTKENITDVLYTKTDNY